MKKTLTILLALFALQGSTQNQNISNFFLPDTEPYIAVNPANANNVIAAWMRFNVSFVSAIAVSYSNNGGVTWSAPQSLPHLYSTFTSADVSIAFSKTGTAYISYVDYLPSKDSGYVVMCSSSNGGQNWSGLNKVINGFEKPDMPVDRPWIAVDRSNGAYNGRIYITSKSVDIGQMPHHVWMKHSSDGGLTWSPIILIDDSIPIDKISNSMGAIDIGSDGSVNVAYFSWHPTLDLYPRAIMVKSTNGGASFTPYHIAYPAANSAITDTLYQGSCNLSINPTNPNNLIFTVTDARYGDPDILSLNSTNGGTSWSTVPVRVNTDAANTGVGQDMCWAGFAPNGNYAAVWRDRRNGGTGSSANFDIYAAVSTDGGLTFKADQKITTASSPVVPITKGNDFIGVSLSSNYLYTDWCHKTANYEIFVNRDTLLKLISVPETELKDIGLSCYPNPFSSGITFNFEMPEAQYAVAEIYDISGRKITTLAAKEFGKGKQTLTYEGHALSEGNYFLRIGTAAFSSKLTFTKTGNR